MKTTDSAVHTSLPHWDVSTVFPALDSPEFREGFAHLRTQIADLAILFDAEQIHGETSLSVTDALVQRFETVTHRFNALLDELRTIRGYIYCFIATDSRNTEAQARMSELRRDGVTLSLLSTRYTAWLGRLPVSELIERSALAADHAYYLWEAKIVAEHLLPPGEEELAAELNLAGGSAWVRLYNDVTSQMTVPFPVEEDSEKTLPMSAVRTLASDPDPEIRRRAYEAELHAWERNAVPLAAALNSIKQEAITLAKRRGWGTPLEVALFNNHIDRETLEAMLSAARVALPDFRRYLRMKAAYLRRVPVSDSVRLPWYDLFAPVGTVSRVWEWDVAKQFVAEQFGAYSPRMRAFAERVFENQWIDAEPRPGKRDGAFCMGLRADESRILQNYRPAFGGVSTLAHELGHAYHNLCLAHRTPLQRGIPMTLAETASIFCETIVKRAALSQAAPEEQLAILEASLQGACQVVVDILSRFLFEQQVIQRRCERELSVAELCGLMIEAQEETYADGLDNTILHPFMWAAKGHYYSAAFYNFPYMFGLLFGLGLYARYTQEPDLFRTQYDELLSLTGMVSATELAARFEIDLRQEGFWKTSLDMLREDISRFAILTQE